MNDSPQQILSLVNRKDHAGFKYIYREYYRSLVGFCVSYVADTDVAEDIVQEVISGIWKNNYRFDAMPKLRTYLYTAVRNSGLNHIKKKATERKHLESFHQRDSGAPDDDQRVLEEEIFRILFGIVEQLPEKCREVFELHLQGKKNDEIALLLNISVATVKTQKNRAMNTLRGKMGHLFSMLVLISGI